MTYPKNTSQQLDDALLRILPILLDTPNHPLQQPANMTFRQIEDAARTIGQLLARRLTADALSRIADEQPHTFTCPSCNIPCTSSRRPRTLRTPDGELQYDEPAAHCDACRRDFFPYTPSTST